MLMKSSLHRTAAPASTLSHQDPEVSQLLAQTRPCAVSFYRPGHVIYAQGEIAGPLYLVEFGTVRICRFTATGRRQISAFHFAGEVFGLEAGHARHGYAESVDNTGIRVLRPALDANVDAGILLLALRALAQIEEHLMILGKMNAPEKMATFLLDLYARQHAARIIELAMQRNDIADYLGMTFETVSRILKVFKDTKMVRLHSVSRIELLDLPALQDLAG
jgi:CRP/FNR family nitrogen fixation transcriptional regulator